MLFNFTYLGLTFFVLTLLSQEYREEFREITGKGAKKTASGGVTEGITLINQRHVGDDLPVNKAIQVQLSLLWVMAFSTKFPLLFFA